MIFKFDVLVIGAGHAGCEAAHAAAQMGARTCLITMDMNKIGQMSCNPAVGGIAKGQIVREIDALGGQMGIVTDRTSIQFRMLNRSKGPAMWSPRSQSDRGRFIWAWRQILENTPNLRIWQDSAVRFLFEEVQDEQGVTRRAVAGVETEMGVRFEAKSVVLTAGTFLNGLMHIGRTQMPGGRISEPASYGLTEQLKEIGFETDRMKTGTPVRLDGRTIDFSLAERQEGEVDFHKFSYLDYEAHRELPQLPCWTIYTNEKVHEILRKGLPDSPLYNGQIQSIGPRYCPSIETKIVTFPDKDKHLLFLEPEGADTQEYYLNGFSSSLPIDVQFEALRQIPALAHAEMYRPGYAIEYDFFDPTQLHHTLETKLVSGLFFAGQVNGTTGYEEAAGQGLVAGVNACLKTRGEESFVLSRDEAYIGVLIDDLVTKGVDEPYRMFTSRAEYRILLRQDDADMRLTEKAYKIGLAKRDRYDLMISKREAISNFIEFTRNYSVRQEVINDFLVSVGSTPARQTMRLFDFLLRPQLTINNLLDIIPELRRQTDYIEESRREEILEAAEILIKYSGYIDRERMVADKLQRLDYINISDKFDYSTIQSLSTEARQKLNKIRPQTIGQASRIPGISPNDINVLLVMLGR